MAAIVTQSLEKLLHGRIDQCREVLSKLQKPHMKRKRQNCKMSMARLGYKRLKTVGSQTVPNVNAIRWLLGYGVGPEQLAECRLKEVLKREEHRQG